MKDEVGYGIDREKLEAYCKAHNIKSFIHDYLILKDVENRRYLMKQKRKIVAEIVPDGASLRSKVVGWWKEEKTDN